MRPLRLTLDALRSYRSPVTIDLTDDGLIAIIGDTGSGKSSILEGLTYALYNASTWSGKDVRELISDGATVMSVMLEFEADGERYRVHRATSRSGYPPAVHRLKCLTDTMRPEIDGVDAVKNEVHRLVGLSYDAFLSAVILPQGKFQNLLQAKRGERVDILKGIFRLDIVESARNEAQKVLSRFDAALNERAVERARFLEDPEGDARLRESEARASAKMEKELAAVAKAVESARTDRRDAETVRAALSAPLEALDRAPADTAGRMRALLPVEEAVLNRQTRIEVQRAALDRQVDDLKAMLDALEKRDEGPDALARALAILDQVDRDQIQAAQRRTRLDTDEADLKKDEAQLTRLEKGIAKLEEDATASGEAAAVMESVAKEAEKNADQARTFLEKAMESHDTVERLNRDVEAMVKRLVDAAESRKAADAAMKASTQEKESAEAALAALMRRHAAAHASEGARAGDDCPICLRPLERGFKPPKVTGESKARAALENAAAALLRATEEVATARAEQGVLAAAASTLEGERKEAVKDLAEERKALAGVVPAALTGVFSEALLKGPDSGRREARTAADQATVKARAARDSFLEARAGIEPRRKGADEQRERLSLDAALLRKLEADGQLALAGLPKFLGLGRETSPAARDAARVRLDDRRKTLAQDVARLETLRDTARGLVKEEAEARSQWTKEIEGPLRRIESDLGHLHHRVNDVAKALGSRIEPAGETGNLGVRAAWAAELESRRRDLLKQLGEKLEAEQARIAAADRAASAALSAAGLEGEEQLEAARIEVRAALKTAERDAGIALGQIADAKDLDRRIRKGMKLRGALAGLVTALADGKFTNFMIDRRQKELLGVATGILGGITGGRFGFSGDFQVVDMETQQPRSTKTLSGGESFLASLSLALALVEIAGRAGGRLDALFLDEGFGALDANALDEALGALESRSGGGRLVAVVSHLKAVAERIDRVLLVTKTPSGSAARWISGSDRDGLVDREIEAGLLS